MVDVASFANFRYFIVADELSHPLNYHCYKMTKELTKTLSYFFSYFTTYCTLLVNVVDVLFFWKYNFINWALQCGACKC